MAQVSYGTITITDVDNGSEAISIAVNANENAAGALSIARSTEQHFWFNPQDIGMGTQLVESGAYITDTPIDIFRKGKNGGYLLARSDGLELGRSTNKFMTLTSSALNFYRPGTPEIDASLSADGLVLAKGGIKAGTEGEIGFIYLSTDNYGTTLTINGHEASDWRQVIGPNFGVRANGIMYATGVNITGDINATGGTIGGFKIDETSIHTKNLSVTSNADNSIALSSVDFNRVINRINREGLRLAIGDKFGITGDGTLYASNAIISGVITVTGGSNVYTKEESNASYNTASSTATRYITYISANDGIKVHNALESSSNYLQLNSTAISLYKGGTQKMKLDAENFRIGDSTNYANVNSDGLQIYKGIQIASFGNTAIIGRIDKNHIEISDTLFQMKTRSVDTSAFVHFKDLRDSTGYALIKRTLIYDLDGQGRINRISLSLTPDTSKPYVIKINGTTITDRNVASISGSYVYIYADAYQVDGTEIYVEYYTSDSRAQTFTFGKRTTSEVLDNAPGGWSFSSGSYNLANGTNSFAQGYKNKANGDSSFATGEGNTAQGNLSAAFGYNTKALSPYSAAFGRNTIARGGLACGYYNNEGFTVGNDFQVGVGSYDEKLNGLAVGYFGIYTTGVAVMQDKLETTSGSLACWKPVLANGISWLELAIYSSSIRYKESITNVIDESLNPHKLYSLPVRQFKFKEGAVKENDPYSLTRHPLIGFIAEEVEKYYPVACIKREGQVEDWDIRYIVPAMLSLVQEQHKEIEELKSCVKKLQNK